MSKNYFWSISLTSKSVFAALWTREDEETSILSFSSEIPIDSEDEYVSAADSALLSLTDEIPDEAGEPSKAIFGVLSSWVADGHIKKEKIVHIKKICENLKLDPVGFVVFSESLAHWVKQEEGGPLTAVVVGINVEDLEVTLFKLGTPQGTINVGRSSSIAEDVVEALSRFGVSGPLPSRFLIFGDKSDMLMEASSELSNTDWEEVLGDKVAFLHSPKIEIINHYDLLVAVSVAGSSEMGPVTKLIVPEKQEESVVTDNDANIVSADNIPNELGFVIDQDISAIDNSTEYNEPDDFPSHTEVHSPVIRKRSFPLLSSLKKKLFKKSKPPVSGLPRKKVKIKPLMIIPVIICLAVAFLVSWYFLPKADITIFISPRSLTTTDTFTLDPNSTSPDVASKVLPVKILTKDVSGDDSTSTTGVKVVGEKAQGKVTIRNGTSSDIKLPVGTLLTTGSDLKFAVSESASVSAALSPTTPGTVTVSATAAVIGSDSNIAQNESLKVGSFSKSEIDAVVSEAFTGGTSRQINAVAKADIDGLERSLTQTLTDKAREELSGEISEEDVFVPDSVSVSVSSKSFDRKLGDEADTLKLSMNVQSKGFSVPKSALNEVSKKLLENQVPTGFTFRSEDVQNNFVTQKSGSNLTASLSLSAHLLPNVSPDEVSRAVSGKSLPRAQEYLSTIPGFVKAAITITPSYPSIFKILPWITKHITVSIEAMR